MNSGPSGCSRSLVSSISWHFCNIATQCQNIPAFRGNFSFLRFISVGSTSHFAPPILHLIRYASWKLSLRPCLYMNSLAILSGHISMLGNHQHYGISYLPFSVATIFLLIM